MSACACALGNGTSGRAVFEIGESIAGNRLNWGEWSRRKRLALPDLGRLSLGSILAPWGQVRRFISYLSALSVLAAPVLAEAHLRLTDPLPRYGDSQKAGPCGVSNGARAGNIYTYEPGETITIQWNEFINHPGHFRISFDADGDDDFVDPAGFDDLNTAASVLVDGIADKAGGDYSYDITLPNVECDNCTLQVIQVMTDKPPYGDGNDIYYQCVDIILAKAGAGADAGPAGSDAGAAVDPPGGEAPLGGGCQAGGNSGPGGAALLFGLWFAMRRRRGATSTGR